MLVFAAMLLLGAVIGFVGAGGAGVMITLLTVGFDVPIHTALGTSLAAMAFTTLSGSYSHFREGNVLRRLGLAMGLFGAVGAFCGALISSSLDTAVLTPLTAAALLLSALLIYLRIFHPHSPLFRQRFLTPRGGRFWLLAGLTGLINGLISGACGVGAASFIQLSLLLVFNAPLYQTVGTTMLVILPIAVLGGAGFLSAGIWNRCFSSRCCWARRSARFSGPSSPAWPRRYCSRSPWWLCPPSAASFYSLPARSREFQAAPTANQPPCITSAALF